MLEKTFIELLTSYTNNHNLINELWAEIEKHYSIKERHYHTLQHLENQLDQLAEIRSEIQDWDTILFSLYYHDIIYSPIKSDNEEKSAEFAEEQLKQTSVSNEKIELCKKQILATKLHIKSTDNDTDYFTDADLSVLGQDWKTYSSYSKNVRKEYSTYSDFVYNSGREKILTHFLTMNRIFKTDFFYNKFETQAKANLTKERNILCTRFK